MSAAYFGFIEPQNFIFILNSRKVFAYTKCKNIY